MKAPLCKKCGSSNVRLVGKRNVIYPVVFYQIFGLLFTSVHQLQSPIDFDCEVCGTRTGRRTGVATFGFWLLILIILAWLSLILPFFRQIVMILFSI